MAEIRQIEVGPWPTNCYIIVDDETRESALIDAAADPEKVLDAAAGSTVRYLLFTHGHRDHIGDGIMVPQAIGSPVAMHSGDAERLPQPPDLVLRDGERLTLGRTVLEVLHIAGHTPGSVAYRLGDDLFVGDTLFPGGPGHTRTPDDLRQIIESITSKIYALPDHVRAHPGHGLPIEVGASKREYAVFASKTHPADLCGDVLWATS